MITTCAEAEKRVIDLIDTWGAPDACVAAALCDARDPSAIAYRIIGDGLVAQDLTYGSLREESERFASALRALGIGPGDRIATLMGKSRRYLVTLMGIWRLGAVHVPLFTAFAPAAIAFRLGGSHARVVVCDANQHHKLMQADHFPAQPEWTAIALGEPAAGALCFDELLAQATPGLEPVAVGGEAPLIHIYTSGTTGSPKGVVVPVRALAAFHSYAQFGQGIQADDTFWCAADPGWAYGLYYGVLSTFLTGVRSLLVEAGFSPETTMSILAREGVTNFAAAPTVYRALRISGAPVPKLRLRCASSAGEPLTADVNVWAQSSLGVTVHDHYGQTEVGMVINNHHHPSIARPIRAGSMGQAMPGWTAAILHETRDDLAATGEIGRVALDFSRSPLASFSGYAGDPAKTEEKFAGEGRRWYVTGDTGGVDEDGYFSFSSRDDDVIIMAGYRIGPSEVESVMSRHVAVAECAVIAVPDAVRGEVMEAYVVVRRGEVAGSELEQSIQTFVKREYAAHAFPRRVHFVDDLPRTASGKIQRFVLKQRRKDELTTSL